MIQQDINIQIGTTPPPIIITCTDSAGDPFDLTSSQVSASLKDVKGVEILDLAPVITDAGAGIITITITDEQTALLGVTPRAAWDLILELSDGTILPPIVGGNVSITETVTLS